MKKMMTGKTIALLVLLALIATSFVLAPTVLAESDAEKRLRLIKVIKKNLEQYLPLLEEIDSMLEAHANTMERVTSKAYAKGGLQAAADSVDSHSSDPLWELFVAYSEKMRKVMSAHARVMKKAARYQRADKRVPVPLLEKWYRNSGLMLKLVKKRHAILTRLEQKYLIKGSQ